MASVRPVPLTCHPAAFVFLYCLGSTVLFERALISAAVSRLETFDAGALLALSTLLVLQFLLTFAALAIVAIVSARAAKALAIALLFGNAAALYFIDSYGVAIDKAMMGNVFNTNAAEAWQLLHPKLLLYLLGFAAVPSAAILVTRVTGGRRGLAISLVATTLLGTGWIYANARSWLWLDHNFSQFGALVLPWSYVVNSVRYQQGAGHGSGEEVLLPAAHAVDPDKVVVVLVIGESARARNFSLYGYPRQTNPLLSAAGVAALPHTRACSTYTTESVRCMLSHQGGQAPSGARYEPLPTYLQRQGVEVTWRTNNWGEPPMKVARLERAGDIRKGCQGADCSRLDTDEVLLEGLEQRVRDSSHARQLLVLHQSGSHGPLYATKYPPRFEVFRPACKTVDLRKCEAAELVNAYDNTIVYTDYFLSRVIAMLKSLGNTAAVMVYVSDHGESLGEFGLYLHGTPYLMAPDVQKEVPFIVWMSDAFVQRRHLAGQRIGGRAAYSQDAVFHSVMGALGLQSDIYRKDLDVFSPPSPEAGDR